MIRKRSGIKYKSGVIKNSQGLPAFVWTQWSDSEGRHTHFEAVGWLRKVFEEIPQQDAIKLVKGAMDSPDLIVVKDSEWAAFNGNVGTIRVDH